MGALARLVVLDDSARAERVDVDPVDLAGEGQTRRQLEPALQLGRCAFATERDLEPPRYERRRGPALLLDERPEVAPQRLVELPLLHLGQIHAHARERVVEAAAHQPGRRLNVLRLEPLHPELGRDAEKNR